jgi:hypothetical protein
MSAVESAAASAAPTARHDDTYYEDSGGAAPLVSAPASADVVATMSPVRSGLHRGTHLTTASRIQEEAAAAAAVQAELHNEARYQQQIALKAKLAQRRDAQNRSLAPLASSPASADEVATMSAVESAAASAAPTARHDDTYYEKSGSDASSSSDSSQSSICTVDSNDDDADHYV